MPHIHLFVFPTLLLLTAQAASLLAAGAPPAPLTARDRMEAERAAAARAKQPSAQELEAQAAQFIHDLDSPEERVRSNAVVQLRLLSRRIDVSGGKRVQRGEAFLPKVPGLLPHLIKAANDPSENIRLGALFALADTLEPEALNVLRDKTKNDPSRYIRFNAGALLTEFNDATGMEELKRSVKILSTQVDEAHGYFEGERVLSSLERITGKSFGPIPGNPGLMSDSRAMKAAEADYAKLFKVWSAWFEWNPPGREAAKSGGFADAENFRAKAPEFLAERKTLDTSQERIAKILRDLSQGDEDAQLKAIGELNLLTQRVNHFGIYHVLIAGPFEPLTPDLWRRFEVPAQSPSPNIRTAALSALADSREPKSVEIIRHAARFDTDPRVSVAAACFLAEFNDSTGLGTLKDALRILQKRNDSIKGPFGTNGKANLNALGPSQAADVLLAMEQLTSKTFGPIPSNPLVMGSADAAAKAEKQYQDLLDNWVAWWDWMPPKSE